MKQKGVDEEEEFYRTMVDISNVADKGTSILCSMGSPKKMPFSLNDLHFIPAQVFKIPLNTSEQVNTEVVIGPEAKKPMKVSSPIMFSGMSYGTVSKNTRLVLASVASNLGLGLNSGEDIILPEELDIASKYLIVQYSTGRLGTTEETLRKAAAIEIRFGQGAYPGWESLLPGEKVSCEIAKLMELREGEDAYSPAHHPDIRNKDELKEKIRWLRELTNGIPIGAKIGCGNVEDDVEILADSGIDFISLDGFGGGTGATEFFVRENVGIPITAALPRVNKHLKKIGVRNKISLIAGGGLRTSADFTKCLALGADAVYIGTSALIAINCQQYRICHTGHCPMGVTTNDPALIQRLDVNEGVRRLTNFMNVSNQEVANLVRIVGKDDIKKLGIEDIVALNKDLSEVTGAKWLNGKNI
ncbi:FMN-binding glutamate synthase family protein [Candidatus Bathyarchaeota archaeon]|nr:FMN-binding glutamate synthase family protein [Candidatus Bathyarchaeota archaeon]